MEDLSVSRWSVVVGRWVGGTLVGGSVDGGQLPVGGRWFCNTPKFAAVNMNQKFTKVTKVFIFVMDTFCTDPAKKFVIIGITRH